METALQFSDTQTLSSKVPGFENVKFTINCFSHGKRTRLRLKLASTLEKVRNIAAEMDDILELVLPKEEVQSSESALIEAVADSTPKPQYQKELRQIQQLKEQIDLLTASEIDPAYLNAGFISLEGITFKGSPFTAETLYENADERLCKEIIQAIKDECELPAAVRANLSSPTTSGAQVDGKMNDTTAQIAENVVSIKPETALSTTI